MTKPDDEELMAYVDGELDSSRAMKVREALRADPELAAHARLFEDTAGLLERHYRPVLDLPLPLRLVRTIARVSAAGQASGAGTAHGRPALSYRLAAAASVAALVVGLAAGTFGSGYWRSGATSARDFAQAEQRVEASRLLQRTLEKSISGTNAAWQDPDSGQTVSVEPLRTFRNEDGRFCREYRESSGEKSGPRSISYGVACRDQGGIWRVRYHLVPGDDPPAALRQ